MNTRTLLLTAPLLAAPALVWAQPVSGLYVGAGAGYNYLQNQDVKSAPASGAASLAPEPGSHLTGSGGPAGLASLGYGFGNGFRVEIQGDWRAQHDKYEHGAGGNYSGGADLQTYGGFVNAVYDFGLGLPVFPYLGVGVGYEETFGRTFRLYRNLRFSGALQAFDYSHNTQGSIAAQGILGAAFPLPGIPGLSVTAEYRFMYVADSGSFDGTFTNGSATFPARDKVGSQYNHAGLIGLRYAFNVPAQPPAPAPAPLATPAPALARTYLVFFDWDRADLTARARQIIGEAAANATHVQVTRIEVNGFTDLSGTPAYNLRLSVRRAESVAAELVRDGISRHEIVTHGFGESDPLVPTAQGVREPQNRRVEIVLN